MAITATSDSASVGTTEFFLGSDSTTATYQTLDCCMQAFVYVASMAAGDSYRIRVYEKTNAQGPLTVYDATITGAQSGPVVTPMIVVAEGWEVSVQKTAGTDRTVHWSLRTVA